MLSWHFASVKATTFNRNSIASNKRIHRFFDLLTTCQPSLSSFSILLSVSIGNSKIKISQKINTFKIKLIPCNKKTYHILRSKNLTARIYRLSFSLISLFWLIFQIITLDLLSRVLLSFYFSIVLTHSDHFGTLKGTCTCFNSTI